MNVNGGYLRKGLVLIDLLMELSLLLIDVLYNCKKLFLLQTKVNGKSVYTKTR